MKKDSFVCIQYDLEGSEIDLLKLISTNKYVYQIFACNCKKLIRKELYKTYHTYRDFVEVK